MFTARPVLCRGFRIPGPVVPGDEMTQVHRQASRGRQRLAVCRGFTLPGAGVAAWDPRRPWVTKQPSLHTFLSSELSGEGPIPRPRPFGLFPDPQHHT